MWQEARHALAKILRSQITWRGMRASEQVVLSQRAARAAASASGVDRQRRPAPKQTFIRLFQCVGRAPKLDDNFEKRTVDILGSANLDSASTGS